MTPLEQAKIIFYEYYDMTARYSPGLHQGQIAKEYALNAIARIIMANPHSNPLNTDVVSTMDFWMEVREELKNLK